MSLGGGLLCISSQADSCTCWQRAVDVHAQQACCFLHCLSQKKTFHRQLTWLQCCLAFEAGSTAACCLPAAAAAAYLLLLLCGS